MHSSLCTASIKLQRDDTINMSCSKSLIKLRTLYSSRIYHPVTLLPIRCLCVAVPRPHSAGPSSNSTERQYATVQRSPKVKEAERARKHHPQAAPRESTQQQWPTPILYTAYMGGGFSIEPAKSVEILEAFSALMKYNRPTSEAVSRLCEGELKCRWGSVIEADSI